MRQYEEFFKVSGAKLEFSERALRDIAKLAIERNTGARGLRAVMEDAMLNIMYDLPSKRDVEAVTITEDVITHGEPPLVTPREKLPRKKEA